MNSPCCGNQYSSRPKYTLYGSVESCGGSLVKPVSNDYLKCRTTPGCNRICVADHSTYTNNRVDLTDVAEGLGQDTVIHRFVFACIVLALMAQGIHTFGRTTSKGKARVAILM